LVEEENKVLGRLHGSRSLWLERESLGKSGCNSRLESRGASMHLNKLNQGRDVKSWGKILGGGEYNPKIKDGLSSTGQKREGIHGYKRAGK